MLAALSPLFWISDEHRVAWFVALGLFVPYLLVIAPFRCGGYTRTRRACRLSGRGLIIGCPYHRLDRLGRIFGHDRDRAAARYRTPDSTIHAAGSVGLPVSRPAGQPTRPRAFDVLTLAVGVSSMIAGWLALFIDPSKM